MNQRTLRTLSGGVAPLFLALLAACAGSGSNAGNSLSAMLPLPQSAARNTLATASTTTPNAATTSILIDAGSPTSADGWSSDRGYTGGWDAPVSSATINTSGVTDPAPQYVYQTQRAGMSAYRVSNLTPNAAYAVRLDFAETWFTQAGQRVFNVSINGSTVLSQFDIIRSSGGPDTAIAKSFSAKADASGTLTIGFTTVMNYPTISGIEVGAGSSSPTPAPTSGYPIYSSYFTGNTPFHHTVAQLMAAGATVLSSTITTNYWAQGLMSAVPASQSGGMGPLYVVKSGDSSYIFRCPAYGTCNANGLTARFPAGAYAQTGSDHHLGDFDPVYLKGEIDGWGGDGDGGQACNLYAGNPGEESCSWGGYFPFSGSGLATSSSSGDAAGYAFGLFNISAQELLNGTINHALGIAQSCLDSGGVYPAIAGRASDAPCPWNEEPNVRYGYMIHLKSWVNVASLGYSQYCRVVVQALQTYGAYTTDSNGNAGIAISVEQPSLYASGSNPWTNTIYPSMAAGGDGSIWNGQFAYKSCLNRLSANDIEVIQISPNLP